MDFSTPFSILNEKLKPRLSTSEQIYSSLNRLEGRQSGRSFCLPPSILSADLDPNYPGSITMAQYPEEPENDTEQEEAVFDDPEEGSCADLVSMNNPCVITECNLNDVGEEELVDEDSSSLQSEERDNISEPTTDGTTDSLESMSLSDKSESSLQMGFVDGTLPDLINSGRLLGRRRTLGHVSTTLNEVRREVELSRRRSIKLKAQVDKLQESRSGPGWSQHRERVREEVLSLLRLLNPLTKPNQYSPAELTQGENNLDIALSQLKIVGRKLAFDHTKQEFKSGKGEEDSAILKQALRDRDEAIEKKKAMEAELLRSKTEMMSLNNQLLEAVQRRLELSLELEAWKEDVQLIIQQQLQMQQEAEQAQRKPSRLGILRRTNRPPMQRPTNFLLSPPNSPSTNPNQIFIPRAMASSSPTTSTPSPTSGQRNWRDRLRRGRKQDEVVVQDCEQSMDGFQVVSLD